MRKVEPFLMVKKDGMILEITKNNYEGNSISRW